MQSNPWIFAVRLLCQGILATIVVAVVISTLYLPEFRAAVVIWLLSVVSIWRPSPASER